MRLIDADALMAKFTPEDWRTPDERWMPERQIGAIIQNAPTIDAVEVVRCGQCKHRVFAEYKGAFHLLCERIDGVEVRPNDFCSYGERK